MTIMTYSPTHDQICAITYERIQRARILHPEKLSLNGRVATVISECCEVLDAIEKGDLNHAMYEYFDVLATAFRGIEELRNHEGVRIA